MLRLIEDSSWFLCPVQEKIIGDIMSLKTTNAIPIPMYATRLPQAVAPEGP